jgi:hypothetical protein
MPVTNPRDEIDAWLDDDVQPLTPPPGTFERISRRARRRKRSQVAISAAAAVVAVAAIAVTPRLASGLLRHGGGQRQPAVAAGTPVARPAIRATGSAPVPSAQSATAVTPSPGPPDWAVSSGLPVPARFRPTSITLIGPAVGAVIGQASCGQAGRCTSLAGTQDDGGSWYGLSAPPAGQPDGSTGVSQLRFLDVQYGWAYGPALYATTDSGASWARQLIPAGRRVTDLETAGNRAFAVLASCSGSGSQYAADCTGFSLYSALAGSASWRPVQVPAGYATMTAAAAGQPAAASLVLASGTATDPEAGTGYLLTPSGALLTGPLTGGAWHLAGQIPAACRVGAAQPDGQPAGVQLASGSAAAGPQLLLSCNVAGGSGAGAPVEIFASRTDGSSWTPAGTAPAGGTATSLAAASGDLAVLGTSTGIDYSRDGGANWQPATFSSAAGASQAAPAGGFSYVGMTTADNGVAVPAMPGLGDILTTSDGGQSWTVSPVRGG